MTTIRNLLADPQLQQKKILEKLLCHAMGITKEQIFTSYEREIPHDALSAIKDGYYSYVVDKKPLEFILGYVEFFQRKFKVDGRCLIPRPETEYMIEGVCEYLAEKQQQDTGKQQESMGKQQGNTEENIIAHNTSSHKILIDVGTGCGVLGLSVLLENPTYFDTAILTEYFEDTFTLAKENYLTYQPQIQTETHIIKCNLLDFVTRTLDTNPIAFPELGKNCDITLVANLPYIPDETFDTQAEDNVKKREPRPAFVGGTDGLDYYREMFAQIFAWRDTISKGSEDSSTTSLPGQITRMLPRETGLDITMFLEMMTRQVDILRKEFGDRIDFSEIKTFHFNIRIVKGVVR